ncbi:hypothetical protein CKO15_01920 [Halorhodospira abdelmalekii]|uniref:type VI secretion system baseplate subunit TssF n=1 Tax=Halorhodospira abdelmalekii TaxID=421629 RepID=UPI0019031E84|nr:type VI secretion system baseplate subunit TssF [Halorhodospira abdelmalekii]MBK1734057.1 hypothetical protein [Halorhodospira abdelmalekii]
MRMQEAFAQEMRRLIEGGAELARAHPEQARMLNLDEVHDRDPYVERLLEGVAYLTAGVRQEVEQSLSVVHEQLLEEIAPELIEPYPSTTVLQVGLDPERLAEAEVPLGALAYSEPIAAAGGVRIPFATLRPLHIRALTLEQSRWIDVPTGGSSLHLRLHGHPNLFAEPQALRELPLWIDAEPALAEALRAALLRKVERVTVHPFPLPGLRAGSFAEGTTGGYSGAAGRFGSQQLHVAAPVTAALPYERGQLAASPLAENPALGRLQDLFHASEQLLFVNLNGLETLDYPSACAGIEIVLDLACAAPVAAAQRTNLLRYGCVPAVNLWPVEAEPVRLAPGMRLAPVRSHGDGPGARVVHRVISVQGRDANSGAQLPYTPIASWGLGGASEAALFRVMRRDRGGGLGEPLIELPAAAATQTLSCSVLCSHGPLPRLHLGRGEVTSWGPGVAEGVTVTNLRRPTPFYPAPTTAAEVQALAVLLRADLERLASGLHLRGLVAQLLRSANAAARGTVAALGAAECAPVSRWRRGVLEQGVVVRLTYDERQLADPSRVLLLGERLHAVLCEWAPLGRYVELQLIGSPSGEAECWTDAG